MTRASGIDSAQKWQSSPIPVKMGATPPGSTPYDNAMVLKEALGLPMQIVSGYKGTAEIRLAADAGEVAGLCGLAWASIKVTWRKQLDSGKVKVVLQNAAAAHPELPDVPLAISFAKNEIGRAHSELQSRGHLVCRLLLEKKKKNNNYYQSKKKKIEKNAHITAVKKK